jgi:hypothetical protein
LLKIEAADEPYVPCTPLARISPGAQDSPCRDSATSRGGRSGPSRSDEPAESRLGRILQRRPGS